MQGRRARTRQLIELGGLMHKAGLVELLNDDRATLRDVSDPWSMTKDGRSWFGRHTAELMRK